MHVYLAGTAPLHATRCADGSTSKGTGMGSESNYLSLIASLGAIFLAIELSC